MFDMDSPRVAESLAFLNFVCITALALVVIHHTHTLTKQGIFYS